MNIGIPKEIKSLEHRVSMTPSSVADLVNRGHSLFVEKDAGLSSNYTNRQYEEAGTAIVDTAQEVFDSAELIVKVKEPQPVEVAMLKPHHILFTYLHLAADKNLTETLTATGATCIAYETIEVNHSLPLLEPMSEIAVDQGGCAETTRATTHENPTFIEEEVVHYCVANMPGTYARTATQALNNATHAWTTLIADNGVKAACEKNADLVDGINCINGKLTCQPVADAHGLANTYALDILNG
eukprot:Seg15454.2 transcript_id=Seg15454.2/GoldUCD/mRNA.D3Y31 product="Alanine dehydrogenase" protein_id=Seg15454.2/GoldUCD/D3Y31